MATNHERIAPEKEPDQPRFVPCDSDHPEGVAAGDNCVNDEKVELVTTICKECQKQKITLQGLWEIFEAVLRFYYQNARP